MLNKLSETLQNHPEFRPVCQLDDHLELPKLNWQIYWSESLDYPGTNRFFGFEDDYQFLVGDSVEEVVSDLLALLADLEDRFS